MRKTQNLNLILEALTEGPKTALELRANLNKVDKTVIYRTIDRLLGSGTVQEVQLMDGKIAYELVEKGHHHHLICQSCNSAECIELPQELATAINNFEQSISNKVKVTDHRVDFLVLCKNCNNQKINN